MVEISQEESGRACPFVAGDEEKRVFAQFGEELLSERQEGGRSQTTGGRARERAGRISRGPSPWEAPSPTGRRREASRCSERGTEPMSSKVRGDEPPVPGSDREPFSRVTCESLIADVGRVADDRVDLPRVRGVDAEKVGKTKIRADASDAQRLNSWLVACRPRGRSRSRTLEPGITADVDHPPARRAEKDPAPEAGIEHGVRDGSHGPPGQELRDRGIGVVSTERLRFFGLRRERSLARLRSVIPPVLHNRQRVGDCRPGRRRRPCPHERSAHSHSIVFVWTPQGAGAGPVLIRVACFDHRAAGNPFCPASPGSPPFRQTKPKSQYRDIILGILEK